MSVSRANKLCERLMDRISIREKTEKYKVNDWDKMSQVKQDSNHAN